MSFCLPSAYFIPFDEVVTRVSVFPFPLQLPPFASNPEGGVARGEGDQGASGVCMVGEGVGLLALHAYPGGAELLVHCGVSWERRRRGCSCSM